MVIAAAALLAACSGPKHAGNVEPASWARHVCAGLGAWRTAITRDDATLTSTLRTNTSTTTNVKRAYTAYYGGAVTQTDALVRALKTAGDPDVENGKPYAAGLRGTVAAFRQALAETRSSFAALPAGGLAAYRTGARQLAQRLATATARVSAALPALDERYGSKALTRALAEDTACSSLG